MIEKIKTKKERKKKLGARGRESHNNMNKVNNKKRTMALLQDS